MIRKGITYLTIWALVLAGCKASCEERVVLRYEPAKRLPMRTSPYKAQYRLYAQASGKPTTRTATPLLAYSLPKGSRLGFERDAEHRLLAVAGNERTVLDAATSGKGQQVGYTWTMQPDPCQTDPLKTTLLFVAIGGIIAGIAIGAAAAASGPSLALAASAP
jgi:hypothetical protein